MGYEEDRESYCHFCAHCYIFGLQGVFAIKMKRIFLKYQIHKVPKSGCGDWWVRLIVVVVIFANNLYSFFLWNIGIEWANI